MPAKRTTRSEDERNSTKGANKGINARVDVRPYRKKQELSPQEKVLKIEMIGGVG